MPVQVDIWGQDSRYILEPPCGREVRWSAGSWVAHPASEDRYPYYIRRGISPPPIARSIPGSHFQVGNGGWYTSGESGEAGDSMIPIVIVTNRDNTIWLSYRYYRGAHSESLPRAPCATRLVVSLFLSKAHFMLTNINFSDEIVIPRCQCHRDSRSARYELQAFRDNLLSK